MTRSEKMVQIDKEKMEAKRFVKEIMENELGVIVAEKDVHLFTWCLQKKIVHGVNIVFPLELRFYIKNGRYIFEFKNGRLWLNDKMAANVLTLERKSRLQKIAMNCEKSYAELADMIVNPKKYGYKNGETAEDIIKSFEEVINNRV